MSHDTNNAVLTPLSAFAPKITIFLRLKEFFSSKTIKKNLDPSYKRDLDLWDCLGMVKLISKFHRTDSVISSHSREGKTPSYSRINTVPECVCWHCIMVAPVARILFILD